MYKPESPGSHSVSNPDMQSERQLLAQLAPDMDEDLIRRLVAAFQDLRQEYNEGRLSYPYSLRGDASHYCL
jgi:von Willebrand factor A domain-containing protein 8